jgi:hypothetical protein
MENKNHTLNHCLGFRCDNGSGRASLSTVHSTHLDISSATALSFAVESTVGFVFLPVTINIQMGVSIGLSIAINPRRLRRSPCWELPDDTSEALYLQALLYPFATRLSSAIKSSESGVNSTLVRLWS